MTTIGGMRAAVALLAALTLVTACGGSEVGAGPASSAGVLKPGAVAYWQTVTDPESAQWQQVEELLGKFPDGDRMTAWVQQELADQGLSWEEDVKPALGTVVDVAVYRGGADIPTVVALTNTENKDQLDRLVAKLNDRSDEDLVTRAVEDWVAISTSDEALDRALKQPGENSFADDDGFESALAELPEDALSRIYVDPARASTVLSRRAEDMFGLAGLEFAAAWLRARDEGAELAGEVRGPGADRLLGASEPYASTFPDRIPDDAFAFVTFQGGGLKGQLERFRGNMLVERFLREFEREAGVDVDEVLSLLDGEVAIYARPGVPTVEITLLLDDEDEPGAAQQVERLLRAAELDDDLAVATIDGAVVVSTARDAADDLQRAGDKLADSEKYAEALDAAEAPNEYLGLLYVDVAEAAALLDSPELRRNLEPLGSLVAFGTEDGDRASLRAFLSID